MLNAKSSENFLSPKFAKFGPFRGAGGQGYNFFVFLLQKTHPCMNPRRLSHFASKLVRGCDLQVGWEKSQKVTEAPIGKMCRR